ncbi:MAG: peptidase S14, partial [Pseudohongiella sp.]
YSAGATFMSSFPVDCRFLTKTTRLMIHERQMNKKLAVNGPLRSCVAALKATLHEIEHSITIEEEGFRAIVKGSKVDFTTIRDRAPENWYIECHEAIELGLIHDVI